MMWWHLGTNPMIWSSAKIAFSSYVYLLLHWPCQQGRMLLNCHRVISPYQETRLLLVSRTHCYFGREMSEPASCGCHDHTCWKKKKMTHWSQVVSSAECFQYPRISLGIIRFALCTGCLESRSRICELCDSCDTQHWHSENGLFFGFS